MCLLWVGRIMDKEVKMGVTGGAKSQEHVTPDKDGKGG